VEKAGGEAPREAEQEAKSKNKKVRREYPELVLLAHATNTAEAERFRSELEAHGIPAILGGEGAAISVTPGDGAGEPILVPEEFADQAAEVIAELESAKPEGYALAAKDDLFEEEDEELEEHEDLDENPDEIDEDDEDPKDTDLEEGDLDEEEDVEDEESDDDDEWEEDEEDEEDEEEWEEDDDDDDDEEDWDEDDDDR
jgi:hypothetical protein